MCSNRNVILFRMNSEWKREERERERGKEKREEEKRERGREEREREEERHSKSSISQTVKGTSKY